MVEVIDRAKGQAQTTIHRNYDPDFVGPAQGQFQHLCSIGIGRDIDRNRRFIPIRHVLLRLLCQEVRQIFQITTEGADQVEFLFVRQFLLQLFLGNGGQTLVEKGNILDQFGVVFIKHGEVGELLTAGAGQLCQLAEDQRFRLHIAAVIDFFIKKAAHLSHHLFGIENVVVFQLSEAAGKAFQILARPFFAAHKGGKLTLCRRLIAEQGVQAVQPGRSEIACCRTLLRISIAFAQFFHVFAIVFKVFGALFTQELQRLF